VSMRKLLLVVAAFGSLAAADNSERDSSRVVQEIPWPSEWTGLMIQGEGADEMEECKLEFLSADKVKGTSERHEETIYYRLDPKAVPTRIDLREEADSDGYGFGIYSIEADILRLCFSRNPESRPSEFSTQAPKGGEVHVILKR